MSLAITEGLDHHPVCGVCGGLWPCEEEVVRKQLLASRGSPTAYGIRLDGDIYVQRGLVAAEREAKQRECEVVALVKGQWLPVWTGRKAKP